MRRRRLQDERNYLIAFFALLFFIGGALILWLYGGPAMAMGIACMISGALLTGLVLLVVQGLDWLGKWLDKD